MVLEVVPVPCAELPTSNAPRVGCRRGWCCCATSRRVWGPTAGPTGTAGEAAQSCESSALLCHSLHGLLVSYGLFLHAAGSGASGKQMSQPGGPDHRPQKDLRMQEAAGQAAAAHGAGGDCAVPAAHRGVHGV